MLGHVALRAGLGRRSRRVLVGGVTAAVAAVTLGVPQAQVNAAAPTEPDVARDSSFQYAIQMGPEERVIGPTGDVDVLYFSERDAKNKLIGFAGTSRTYVWRSQGNRRISKPRLILDRGPDGSFDRCGAWLNGSIFKLTRRHWIGWYHAESMGPGEHECDREHDTVVFRVGFTETRNAGRTWVQSHRASSVALTGPGATATTGTNNGGSPRVVRIGEYYYMFFMAGDVGQTETYLARSLVTDQGRPGTWKKYYCQPVVGGCGYTEPGISGNATAVKNLASKARYVTWNTYLQRWVGFYGSGRIGFRMYASKPVSGTVTDDLKYESLTHWQGSQPFYAPVSREDDKLVDQWGTHIRNHRSRLLYAYPSMLGATGNSRETGKSFYVYYVKLYPGDNFNMRYLFRRKITVQKSDTALNRVALTTYRKGAIRRTSTDAPKLKAFRRVGSAGFVRGDAEAGWFQVQECTKGRDSALFRSPRCPRGWKPFRRVGWVYPTRSGEATVPIFRCFDRRSRTHFAANLPRCNGAKREARIGFGLRGF